MNYQHKELAAGRWYLLTFFEQMANIGSEIERSILWGKKNNPEYCQMAFDRALELLDLTLMDKRNITRLRELARVREALADHFVFTNTYQTTDESWQKYFYGFTFAARLNM